MNLDLELYRKILLVAAIITLVGGIVLILSLVTPLAFGVSEPMELMDLTFFKAMQNSTHISIMLGNESRQLTFTIPKSEGVVTNLPLGEPTILEDIQDFLKQKQDKGSDKSSGGSGGSDGGGGKNHDDINNDNVTPMPLLRPIVDPHDDIDKGIDRGDSHDNGVDNSDSNKNNNNGKNNKEEEGGGGS